MGDVAVGRLVHIGVDIGQKHDSTAIVVCQVMERLGKELPISPQPQLAATMWSRRRHETVPQRILETYYEARFIERVPLNVSYPDIATRIAEIATSPALNGSRIRLAVDVTGVGQPVYEMVKDAVSIQSGGMGHGTPGITMRAITFTHGDTYKRGSGMLGKAYLVSRLQALFQTHCIKLPPRHVEAQAMARELKDYEIRIDAATANDTYGAFKVGSHDDLVTALGLATLDDPHEYRATIGPRLF